MNVSRAVHVRMNVPWERFPKEIIILLILIYVVSVVLVRMFVRVGRFQRADSPCYFFAEGTVRIPSAFFLFLLGLWLVCWFNFWACLSDKIG